MTNSLVAENNPPRDSKIPVGLSACLEGQSVRYNGGHCQSALCLKTLSNYFQYRTFCPEASAGFGIPRPAMRLAGDPQSPKLIYVDSDKGTDDLAPQLRTGMENELTQLDGLDGYILMKNSPSCGLERVKVYMDNGYPHKDKGSGLFAKALQERYPLMPLEEEGRLHDPALCENFVLRVYAHHHFRNEVRAEPTYGNLLAFHSSYKFVLLAHSQPIYRELGRYLADASRTPIDEVLEYYQSALVQAMAKPAKRSGHTNVLMHLLGFLKHSVDGAARQNIVDIIHRYRIGQIPLITPLTLLRHYIEREGSHYVRAQRYWEPYPDDLGLRNRL